MRKAALQAGTIDTEASDKLLFALEPESASITVFGEASTIGLFKDGTTYMMLDYGGGTVDITLHNVATSKPLVLDEICNPGGGKWGDIYVDNHFRVFLQTLLGRKRFSYLKDNHYVEAEEVMDEFREKKQDFDPEEQDTLTKINLSGLLCCDDSTNTSEKSLVDLINAFNLNEKNQNLTFDLSNRRTHHRIEQFSSLVLSHDQMLTFFQPTLDSICLAVKKLLAAHWIKQDSWFSYQIRVRD